MLCSARDRTCSECQQLAAAAASQEPSLVAHDSHDPQQSPDPAGTPPSTPSDGCGCHSHEALLKARAASGSPPQKRDASMVFGIDKVLSGIVKYHQTVRAGMVEQFRRVKDNPVPSVLMFTCMDSRMIPSRFTQSDVGEMFIVRNAGVLIPHHKYYGNDATITTEPGALELACVINAVQDIIVCGHSDCKAMNLLQSMKEEKPPEGKDYSDSPLRAWVMRYGGDSYTHFETMLRAEKNRLVFMEGNHAHEAVIDPRNQFSIADKFSQVSTLHQLENITSYPFMQRLVDGGLVRLHAMWFDIYTGNIFYFSKPHKSFIEITDDNWDDFLDEKEREALNKQVKFGMRRGMMP